MLLRKRIWGGVWWLEGKGQDYMYAPSSVLVLLFIVCWFHSGALLLLVVWIFGCLQ